MARKMKKQYVAKAAKPKGHRRRKQYVPGYGGMAGRAIGYFRKNLTTKGSTMNWLLKKTKQLADAVNIEYKIYDNITANSTPDYNGTIVSLNLPAQGTADTQRIGDSIKCQHLVVRGQVVNNPSASILNHTRVILVWDEQNQITALSDLLETTGSSNVVFSPKHYDKRFRSNVLYDQMFTTSTYSGSQAFWKDFEINLPIDKHTQFSAASTTINTGALKMILMSSGVTTNLPSVTFYSRLSFTDD